MDVVKPSEEALFSLAAELGLVSADEPAAPAPAAPAPAAPGTPPPSALAA